jgi:hypothetical protein
MKLLSPGLLFLITAMRMATGCTKPKYDKPENPFTDRKIRFQLYTDQDFSNNNGNINFTLFIEKPINIGLWDSLLPPMKLKDIPGNTQKLVIEKTVPGNHNGLLRVGIRYTIDGVGNSDYLDSSNAGDTLKIVDFNFK